MYQVLKKILFGFFPKKIIYANEEFFRSILYLLKFKGKNNHCKVCNKGLKQFIKTETGLLCPNCGSLPRTRFLKLKLDTFDLIKKRILHFSPHRQLQKDFSLKLNSNYYASDFLGDLTPYHFDIQNMSIENNFFDIIICYHVLEHVPDDIKSMNELYRVLKPNGIGLFQVPFNTGPTIEDPNETDPKVRLAKFGQEDHLRWYNLDDFCKRLESVGFKTEKIELKNQKLDFEYLGLNINETVVKVTK